MGEVDDHSHVAYLDGGPSQPIADVKTLFEETATKHPDIEAIVSLHQGPVSLPRFHPVDGEKRLALTYKELKHASDVLAHRLKSFGLCPGTSVAFFSENCAEWVLFCWACVSLGCPLVTMNPAVLGSVNELRHMLQVTGPGVIVVQDVEMGKKLKMNAPGEMEEVFLRISLSKSGAITVPDTLNQEHRESSDEGTPHERLQMREGGPEFRFSRSLGWIYLPDIHAIGPASITYPPIPTKKFFPGIIAIGFTSGTTSLPKACPQSITNIQTTCGIARARGVGPGHRNLQQAPAYHSLASLPCFAYWSTGGTIVFPSARFDVMASLAAAEKEQCTLMAAVPAVVKALTMVPNVAKKLESVKSIVLAGAPVFPEIIQLCRDVLKIENVSVSWGMTENTSPLSAHVGKDIDLKNDEFFPVGTPTPGMKVKVCAPGSRVPLKRAEEGELHTGGPQVIRGYLDVENHTFYEDEDGWWVMTGDAASVGEDGQVRILGRYKDIIIRGGVNIAPAKIEQCLNNVRGIDSQAVGMPDEMAGEVPVAIIRFQGPAAEDPKAIFAKLKELALRELGPKLAPIMYIDLKEDLGMQMFPMTSSGKAKKTVLRQKVQELVAQRARLQNSERLATGGTADVLIEIWSQVSGVGPEKIDATTDVLTFVDSITIMRFSSAVRKRLQKDITVTEVGRYTNVQEQARLLDSREVIVGSRVEKRASAPTAAEMVHCQGDESKEYHTRELAMPLLTKLGLDWDNDVEDVFPAPDTISSIYLRRRRPQTWNQRAIFIAHHTPLSEFSNAWKATLCHQPLVRSLAIKYGDTGEQLFLVMQDNENWWRTSILPSLKVATAEDLRNLYREEWADPDTGPLVKVAFAKIEDRPNDSAIIMIWNHAVLDNMAANLFFEDFITAIEKKLKAQDVQSAPGHLPFKTYAEKYYLHRAGSTGKEVVAWHVARLRGISDFEDALWPEQRAPGWYKGADSGWKNSDGTVGDPALRIPLDKEGGCCGLDGLTRTVKAPGLAALREQHRIQPYAILKAALALFNVHRTGLSTALFANLEAARYWPFTSDWTSSEEKSLLNPLNVAGPMFEVVVNRIDLSDENEAVLSFLKRVQKDQLELSEHSHVPLFELLAALPPEDAAIVREVMDRQIWNWPAGIQVQAQTASSSFSSSTDQSKEQKFRKLTRAAYDDVGLAWTCGLWDKESFYLNASYDDCQLAKVEVEQVLGEVLGAARWLVGHLGCEVGECVFEGSEVGGLIASLE